MKRIAKKILKIILWVTISIILILFGFYVWLNLRIDNVIDKETYNHFVEEIKASEDLPERFYEIYGQVTQFDKKSTVNRFIFHLIVQNKRKSCPCMEASYGIVVNTFDNWTVALALDKEVSPKKCLDFYLSKYDFLYNTRGINNASQFYYQKDLGQLNDDEMLELSIMTINPSLYNKIRHPERLRDKVEKIKTNK